MPVEIRPFCDETDAESVADIWVSGLTQTWESKGWSTTQWIWKQFMEKLAAGACAEDGDVGPRGRNIIRHWPTTAGDANDIRRNKFFFVAVDPESSDSFGKPRVVGCLGVKRGTSEKDDIAEIECSGGTHVSQVSKDLAKAYDSLALQTFSVWRLSVCSEYRKKGVGRKLMNHAEEWARARDGQRMQVVTGNSIANGFYIRLGYHQRWGGWSYWHEKVLVNPGI